MSKDELDYYLKQGKIRDCFQDPDLSFRLIKYQKGELLSSPDKPLDMLLFLVEGTVRVYGLREDGSILSISMGQNTSANGIMMLGDMEFARKNTLTFYIEAMEDVICIALPLEENRHRLEQDPVFLQFIIHQLGERLHQLTVIGNHAQPLEERLLTYLQEIRPDHALSGMEAEAVRLRVSRRQLQRAVEKMTRQGILKKTGRGRYRLKEN